MGKWLLIDPAGRWKPHVVPASLADLLVADLRARGCDGDIAQRSTTRAALDSGGMCYASRPVEEFTLRGLTVAVPSEDVPAFCEAVAKARPRTFGALPYHKVHSRWSCLVLTPEMWRQLLRSLERRAPAARARSDAFYAKVLPGAGSKETGR